MIENTVLKVGEVFPHGAPSIPLLVSLSQSPLMCVITLPNITPNDEEMFAHGKSEFSYCQIEKGIISFMVKIHGLVEWCDSQYTPRADLFENIEKGIETSIGIHTPIILALVERETGIIKGIRVVTVSHPFVFRLNRTITEVNKVDLSEEVYYKKAQSILNNYTTKQLVKLSKHIERGGQTVN